ncbi:putative nuclease HARBI1 [Dermacentor andersoni]|uniref:putative nuclease HARBI1 n=1 Tax=Dermacentor andersoni TaxID=34620 RepID=UPI003B3A7A3D
MAFFSAVPFRVACAAAAVAQRRRPEVDDAFEELTEEEFRQYFRLSKRTVRSLCDELDPIIGCQRASGLSTERKVLCALRFFGTGSFQRSVGREEHVGMAQSAVSSTIHEVTEAIISVSARRKLVDFPLTPAARDEAKAAFARRGAIPGVLACVDGILIAIMKPEGLSPADTATFMSRKGYYALNVMVLQLFSLMPKLA